MSITTRITQSEETKTHKKHYYFLTNVLIFSKYSGSDRFSFLYTETVIFFLNMYYFCIPIRIYVDHNYFVDQP